MYPKLSHPALGALALAVTLGLAGAAPARAGRDLTTGGTIRYGNGSHWSADGNIVDVEVRVDGATAPLFFRPGRSDRHYFQAFRGRNYSLLLRNTTGRRIGVLIAVDGLNVVNGERSSLGRGEPMYVLDPWESAEINGWRSSLDEVRRFVFVDEQRSYAERTGQANGDMGWIRVAAYREVRHEPWWGERYREERGRDDSDERQYGGREGAPEPPSEGPQAQAIPDRAEKRSLAPKSQESNDESAPGTGWGDRRYDPVQRTTFEAEWWASGRVTLRYEYTSGLRALGILPARTPRVWDRDRGQLGFAQPPRW